LLAITLNVLSPLSVQGKWVGSSNWNTILDPLNGDSFINVAEVDETGIQVHPCNVLFALLTNIYFEICSTDCTSKELLLSENSALYVQGCILFIPYSSLKLRNIRRLLVTTHQTCFFE